MSKFFVNLNLFGSASKKSPPAAAATTERGHTMQQQEEQEGDDYSATSDIDNRNMPTLQLEDVFMETQEYEEAAVLI
jgi:hypothetical protein